MSRSLPPDMVEYLLDYLSPPEPFDRAIFIPDLHAEAWEDRADESLTGLLTVGTPSVEETAEIQRVLKPGAHLLVAAPEDSPLGHRGACTMEDGGLQIRDTILVLEDETDGFHYVPKVKGKEREAGCQHLPGKTGGEATGRTEGSAGINNPRAGASRTRGEVKNFHPCVKPRKLMESLLEDIPEGTTVVDHFMGSGSTGIGCLAKGLSFIGIDMMPEHLEIADARLAYWAKELPGIREVTIESERRYAPIENEEPEDLFDLMFNFEE